MISKYLENQTLLGLKRSYWVAAIVILMLLSTCEWSTNAGVCSSDTASSYDGSHFPAQDGPDVVLRCRSYNSISVESGDVDVSVSQKKNFSKAAIKKLLRKQRHKAHILILLSKGVAWASPSDANSLAAFERFTLSLGYQRTVILGCRAFSMPVVFDSAYGGHLVQQEASEPVVIRR
jgi:hypothetical protein